MTKELIRVQKIVAQSGYCSRRRAEELIAEGKINVNDKIVELGTKIDPNTDVIKVGRKIIKPKNEGKIYLVMNKPVGYICSSSSSQGKTVLDLIKPADKQRFGRIYPVGRLDKDSQGLVLLTNDGELTNQLTHPSFQHSKEYQVIVRESVRQTDLQKMEDGMHIDRKKLQGVEIKNVSKNEQGQVITLVLKEGKNRQLRKMFGSLGYSLVEVKRVSLGKLRLGELRLGEYEKISKIDIV